MGNRVELFIGSVTELAKLENQVNEFIKDKDVVRIQTVMNSTIVNDKMGTVCLITIWYTKEEELGIPGTATAGTTK